LLFGALKQALPHFLNIEASGVVYARLLVRIMLRQDSLEMGGSSLEFATSSLVKHEWDHHETGSIFLIVLQPQFQRPSSVG
jgi:hypothetical protein